MMNRAIRERLELAYNVANTAIRYSSVLGGREVSMQLRRHFKIVNEMEETRILMPRLELLSDRAGSSS